MMVPKVCPLGQHTHHPVSQCKFSALSRLGVKNADRTWQLVCLTSPAGDFAHLRTSSVDDSIQEVVSQQESWREMQAEGMALKWLPSLEWPGRGQVQLPREGERSDSVEGTLVQSHLTL